jgi:phage-related protein
MITFKGITSDSLNVVVNKLPTFKKPQRKTDIIQIEGKDGAEVIEYGYAPYTLSIKITLMDVSKIDDVIAWLDGEGVLISSEDSLRCVNARVIGEINYNRLMMLKEATVEFYIKNPFRYLATDIPQTITTFPSTITNTGTVYSKPLLTIVGSGSVTLTINGVTFGYTFPLGESVTIDCESMDATYSGSLRNQYMSGYFPQLSVGSNAISKTGDVTSIKFERYSRWL